MSNKAFKILVFYGIANTRYSERWNGIRNTIQLFTSFQRRMEHRIHYQKKSEPKDSFHFIIQTHTKKTGILSLMSQPHGNRKIKVSWIFNQFWILTFQFKITLWKDWDPKDSWPIGWKKTVKQTWLAGLFSRRVSMGNQEIKILINLAKLQLSLETTVPFGWR